MSEVYIVVSGHDYEGYELPEECFVAYADAVSHLQEIAKQMRRKVRKGNYIQFGGGRVEIHTLKVNNANLR